MDGVWNTAINLESTTQGRLMRHRILRFNISTTGLIAPGDASTLGASAPFGVASIQTGPHFNLSPVTPDNSPTYGFEFCLVGSDLLPAAEAITFPAGGVNVTIWALVGTLSDSQSTALWTSFATLSGVQQRQTFHSFDMNAGAIRFQISGTADDTTAQSVLVAFCEL